MKSIIADQKMQTHQEYAFGRANAAASLFRVHLERMFHLPPEDIRKNAHRPVTNEERHRQWSRLKFLGKTAEEIAEIERFDIGAVLDVSTIGKGIARHRKRRGEQRQLRSSIYWGEFAGHKS